MKRKLDWRAAAALGLAAAAGAAPVQSQETGPEVLTRLERGQWELRDIADERRLRASTCVGDPMLLMQAEHGAAACQRTVIAADATMTTVHYRCPGAGWGRTTLRIETPRLARIDSQGLHRGVPFGFRAEARRIGPCAPAGTR